MKANEVPEKFVPGWLDQLDGRLAVAKDVRARFELLTEDLGGLDTLSYQRRSLVERAVWLEFWLAQQERVLAQGGDFAVGVWTQGCNALLGLYRHLGIERKAKNAETLHSYMARRAAEEQSGGRSAA
jgi:hypothetical protein